MRTGSPVTAFIGIGSNMGDRKANIEKALKLVDLARGIRRKRTSTIYETDPVGGPQQGKFLNGVFEIKTTLAPSELLKELKRIERHLGRKKTVKNGPRIIDLDILTFGDKRLKERGLEIPHPRMHKREFVLKGLKELKKGKAL